MDALDISYTKTVSVKWPGHNKDFAFYSDTLEEMFKIILTIQNLNLFCNNFLGLFAFSFRNSGACKMQISVSWAQMTVESAFLSNLYDVHSRFLSSKKTVEIFILFFLHTFEYKPGVILYLMLKKGIFRKAKHFHSYFSLSPLSYPILLEYRIMCWPQILNVWVGQYGSY